MMKKICRLLASLSLILNFQVKADEFQYSEDGAPTSIDPTQTSNIYADRIATAIFDTLYEFKYLKRPFEVKENLADGMPEISGDGKTYKIKIKKEGRFSDNKCFTNGKGRNVTAHDFVYSIQRHFDPKNKSQMKFLFDDIQSIKALDDYNIEIVLKKPRPQFIFALTKGAAGIVPKEAVVYYGKDFGLNPVGSGPWILHEKNHLKAILVKNPNYRDDIFDLSTHGYKKDIHNGSGIEQFKDTRLPILNKVTIHFMGQDSSRWLSFNKGNEVQYTTLPSDLGNKVLISKSPIKMKPEYEKKYNSSAVSDLSTIYFEFNMDNPEFGYHKDPKQNKKNQVLRCAIRDAYNWDQMIARRYHGLGKAYKGIIPPEIEGFSGYYDTSNYSENIKKAKKSLIDAGWAGQNLPFLQYTSTARVVHDQTFTLFKDWMTKIGYPKSKISHKKFPSFSEYWKTVKTSKLSTHSAQSWSLDYPDAENILQVYYGPNAAPGANNANYKNPEYDKIFEQASVMQPGPERTKLYQKLNEILYNDCVTISGFSRTQIHLWHKDIVMFPAPPVISNIFKWIGYDKRNTKALTNAQ